MCNNGIYKQIIWVEDFDTKNITIGSMPAGNQWDDEDESLHDLKKHSLDIKNTFGDRYYNQVRLFMGILDALKFIDNNMNFFDCVVLDVNLAKSLDDEQKQQICKMCKKRGVKINDDIGIYGGYYIFLYLLRSGFPTEHVCMFTGNKGKGNSTDKWEEVFNKAGIVPPKSIRRDGKEELQDWIDSCYSNSYYKIRHIVYQACEYWKDKLKNTSKKQEIAFNKIYYSNKEYEKSAVEKDVFINMLERIEMLYPITEPSNCNMVYYQALQVATSFHEESAKIKIIDENMQLKKYHQAVRNYRNWSAHNKFICNEIDSDMFVYMFCLTLRTYFQKIDGQFMTIDSGIPFECYIIYERDFFNKYYCSSLDINKFKKKYKYAFDRHLNKVKKHDKKSNDRQIKNDRIPVIYECKNINELLLSSGNIYAIDNMEKMFFSDLLMSIIDDLILQKTKFGYEDSSNGWEYKIRYYWDFENIELKEKNLKDDFFRYIAYKLFEKV